MKPVVVCLLVIAAAAAAFGVAGCANDDRATAEELMGPDKDHNGVRDDIDEVIATMDRSLTNYLRAVAINEQHTVTLDINAGDAHEQAYRIATEANRLISCPPDDLDEALVRDASEMIRSKVVNTAARRARQHRFSKLIDGRSFLAPDCDAPLSGGASQD